MVKKITNYILLLIIVATSGCGRKKLKKVQPSAHRIDNRHINMLPHKKLK